MIADGRAEDGPPVDQLAEAICLSRLLFRPKLMDSVNLGPMLTVPAHRVIWQVMVHVRMRGPELDGHEFFDAWFLELRRRYPHLWLQYYEHIQPAQEMDRVREEYELAREADPEALVLSTEFHHTTDWWLGRLKRIHQARQCLSALQSVAEELWRVPERDVDELAIRELQAQITGLLSSPSEQVTVELGDRSLQTVAVKRIENRDIAWHEPVRVEV